MFSKNGFKRSIAALLAMVLVWSTLPINVLLAYAATSTPSDENTVIIGFSPLDDEVRNQTVPFGTDKQTLYLPNMLGAYVKMPAAPAEVETPMFEDISNPSIFGLSRFGSLVGMAAPMQPILVEIGQDEDCEPEDEAKTDEAEQEEVPDECDNEDGNIEPDNDDDKDEEEEKDYYSDIDENDKNENYYSDTDEDEKDEDYYDDYYDYDK